MLGGAQDLVMAQVGELPEGSERPERVRGGKFNRNISKNPTSNNPMELDFSKKKKKLLFYPFDCFNCFDREII